MPPAISIEHVSKAYRLGTIGAGTLHEDLGRWWARVRRRPDPLSTIGEPDSTREGDFRALDDVSFDVEPGEVLGVVGRNGAGKSTLLKILSQVTAPTSGHITVRGRVASLLEVGTGFHPELTGRENIFLNGAILGMTKAEIRRNLDDIVAFSECEAFIDTPVKRYSSGMYVRLAFAVAAHLESEILIVDEVLAVGDATFQKKCLGKMRDVSRHGRTILFVSHSMAAVAALCNRAVLLRTGRLVSEGATAGVIAHYQADGRPDDTVRELEQMPRQGSGKARFVSLDVRGVDAGGRILASAVTGSSLLVQARVKCLTRFDAANVAVTICDATGYRLIDVNTALKGQFLSLRPGEHGTIRFRLDDVLLKPGAYSVNLWVGRGGIENMDSVDGAGTLVIHDDPSSQRHTEVFPGTYQCRFSTSMDVEACA